MSIRHSYPNFDSTALSDPLDKKIMTCNINIRAIKYFVTHVGILDDSCFYLFVNVNLGCEKFSLQNSAH